MELAWLDTVGRQFIEPAIPHGAENTATNRPEPTVITANGEQVPESAVSTAPEVAEVAEVPDASNPERPEDAELQPV